MMITTKAEAWQDCFASQNIQNKLHEEFNLNAAREALKRRHDKNDLVLAFWGVGHKDACEKLKDSMIVVEPSIGYDSFFAHFRVFESYSHLHKMLGGAQQNRPSPTDHVIPPGFYALDDFEFSDDQRRLLAILWDASSTGKGVHIADQLSRNLRQPIKFVGPQTLETTLPKNNPYAEYIHTVSYNERKDLLKNAKGLLMPSSLYGTLWMVHDRGVVLRNPRFDYRLGGSS